MAVAALRLPRGIRQRGNSYLVDVTIRGKRQTATCHSIEEALAHRRKLKDGQAVSPEAWTLQQALDTTIRTTWTSTAGEKTATTNARTALEFFGSTYSLSDLTNTKVSEFVDHLMSEGLSNGTINRKLAALSKILRVARKMGGLAAIPEFDRKKEGQGRIRFLTPEEEQRHLMVANQWGKEDHTDACIVLVDTGLRPSELWRLEPQDLTFKPKPLATAWETKNGTPRSVPLTRRAAEVLWRRSRVGKPFPFSNDWMGHTWDKIREHLGFSGDKQYVPYVLRHTCCSRLVQRGVHLKVVQEWMGHKTIEITMRYAHLAPTSLLAAVGVLEQEES